jgi:hypothetical protein
VKAVWSILLGLIMALSSFAFPANDTPHIRVCSCCSCAQLDCCGTPVSPNPAPLSAPSKSTERRVQTPVPVNVAVLAAPIPRSAPEFSISSLPLLSRLAVPIYERHCSYLI